MSPEQVQEEEAEESEAEDKEESSERFPEEEEAIEKLEEAVEEAGKFKLGLEAARDAGIDEDDDFGLARWDMARTLLDFNQEDTIPDLFDAVQEAEEAAEDASERLAEEPGYKDDAQTVYENWDDAPWRD